MSSNIEKLKFSEETPVNVRESAKNIADRYDQGILDGLQNETIQNSVDGYEKNLKNGNIPENQELQVELTYYPSEEKFTWKDNAGGMSREVLEKYFLSLSFKEKVDGSFRGSRGEGAGVFMELGNYVGVESRHQGKTSTGAWNCKSGKRTFEWESQKLAEDGTLVEVFGVKEEYANKLEDIDRVEMLARRWWHKILQREDINVTYEVKGVEKREITAVDISDAEEVVKRNIDTGEGIKVDKLEIYIFDEKRPNEFSRALALNIHEHTIDWTTPKNIPSQKRIVAFAEAPGLREYEKPSHRGFRRNSVTSNVRKAISGAIKEVAEREIDEVEELTEEMENDLSKMIDLYNDWIGTNSEVFDFMDGSDEDNTSKNTEGGKEKKESRGSSTVGEPEDEDTKSRDDSEQEEKETPHISQLSTGKRDFERGDTVNITTYLKNPLRATYKGCSLKMVVKNPEGNEVKEMSESEIELKSNQERQPRKTYEFEIPENGDKGRYVVKAVFKSDKGYTSKTTWFRVEVEPQDWKSSVPSGGLGLNEARLAEFDVDKEPVERDQAYLMLDEGRILINLKHPGFDRALDRDELAFYSFQCAVIEAINYRIKTVVEQSQDIQNSEEVKHQLDSMMDLISHGNAFIAESEL